MSHITRCPACHTHFRVVDDQLKISDGWVRCGQCGEVFDAHAHLFPEGSEGLLATDAGAAATPPDPAPVSALEADEDSLAAEGATPSPPDLTPDIPLDLPPLPEPDRSDPEPLWPGAGLEVPALDVPPVAQTASDAPATLAPEMAATPPAAGGDPDSGVVPPVSFVKQARRRAFWQKAWVRWALALTAVVLALALVWRVAVDQRHRWVAAYPPAQEWVAWLCAPLGGCEVHPYRDIVSVLIDSSALVRERPDLFRLEVALKNTSATPLAMPAVELSLTDPTDAVVLRRVLLPADWDSSPNTLPPQAVTVLTLRLSLSGVDELRMAGYRALVFYP